METAEKGHRTFIHNETINSCWHRQNITTYQSLLNRMPLCTPLVESSCVCKLWGRCGVVPPCMGSWYHCSESLIHQRTADRISFPNYCIQSKLVGTIQSTTEYTIILCLLIIISRISVVWENILSSPFCLHQEHRGIGSVLCSCPGAVKGAFIVLCRAVDVT